MLRKFIAKSLESRSLKSKSSSKRSRKRRGSNSASEPEEAVTLSGNMRLSGSKEKRGSSSTSPGNNGHLTIKANGFTYVTDRIIGNGSFGVVFQASCTTNNETVAIKKVLQDKRFKNRELQIMKILNHQNVVRLENSFFSTGDKDEVFLNLVLEYVPETLHRVARHYAKMKKTIPLFYTKLYIYQMARALNYIHSIGICHRDIKPQNVLLNPRTGVLKICDFGSAKMLVRGEPNVAYICSRYYRAPELIFGANDYTNAIDVWSLGCVLVELLIGEPLFPGASAVDQLVEIVKVLGTPTNSQITEMNSTYQGYRFPNLVQHDWREVLGHGATENCVDLVSKILVYSPSRRLRPLEICAHPWFDELRVPGATLPNGRELPPLFNFTPEELQGYPQEVTDRLVPRHFSEISSQDESALATSTITTTTTTLSFLTPNNTSCTDAPSEDRSEDRSSSSNMPEEDQKEET